MISLEQKFPNIAQEWDHELNGNLKPSDITYGSHQSVFWKCSICGYSYQARVCNRTAPSRQKFNGNNCPICRGYKIVPEYNSLKAKFPDISKEWDYTKNDVGPDQVAPYSNKKYWWICKEGHSYQANPNNRVHNVGNCPFCSHQKLHDPTSLEVVNPRLAKEWDYDANSPLTPKDVFANANKSAHWICSKCGHKWKAKINNRSNGRGCPNCSKGAHSSFPEQVIFYYVSQLFPDAINGYKVDKQEIDVYIPSLSVGIEYDGEFYHKKGNRLTNDYKKNAILKQNGIDLIRIRESNCPQLKDNSCIIYHCKYAPDYSTLEPIITDILDNLCEKAGLINKVRVCISDIRDMIVSQLNKVKYEDSLAAFIIKQKERGEKIVAIWDDENNFPLKPEMVTPFSDKVVYWICPNNKDHRWRSPIKSVSKGYGCSRCAKRHKYTTEEWVAAAKVIHPGKYDYSPSVYINSKTPISIICPIHGVFTQFPSEHLAGKGCKYCSHQAFHPLESLANKHPEIAAEWDYDKNSDSGYTPETIGINTQIRFWWHCTNGESHSFQATIAKRVSGTKCAVCHGKQHSLDTSIAVLYPEICREWSDKNKKSPTEYSRGSEAKVLWKCPNNEHPDYLASVYSRIHLKSGCPLCAKKKM